MSTERAIAYLEEKGYGDRVIIHEQSCATVELAALALGVDGARIAKSLTFMAGDKPLMVVTAGDMKIDNPKYKAEFGIKAKMLTPAEVDELIGHSVGGVCPFGINDGVRVVLDVSLKRFDVVYPACGGSNNAVKLTVDELEKLSAAEKWVDVCKSSAPAV